MNKKIVLLISILFFLNSCYKDTNKKLAWSFPEQERPCKFLHKEFRTLSSFSIDRKEHNAVLLPNNNILITGGKTRKATIYDIESDEFTDINSIINLPEWHTASLTEEGVFLIGNGEVSDVYKYDWKREEISALDGELNHLRDGHTATILNADSILIVGGNLDVRQTEIYVISDDTFVPQGENESLLAIKDHAATTFYKQGRLGVLVSGGRTNNFVSNRGLLFNELGGYVGLTSNNMSVERFNHTATLLQSGEIVIMGGQKDLTGQNESFRKEIEIYHMENRIFSIVDSVNGQLPRNSGIINHTASAISCNRILLVGGDIKGQASSDCKVFIANFNQNISSIDYDTLELVNARYAHTATVNQDSSKVYIIGGWNAKNSMEVYIESESGE